MSQLMAYRGCSRLEYRNQNIKLLRGLEGERTRSSYRTVWLGDNVRDLLRQDPNPVVIAGLVDRAQTQVLPLRQMIVIDHEFTGDVLRLTFELASYISVGDGGPVPLTSWAAGRPAPPRCYLSTLENPALPVRVLRDPEVSQRWRQAVDFLAASWDFSSTGFFRLQAPGAGLVGHARGPVLEASEGSRSSVRLESYNPHLPEETWSAMRLRVAGSGSLVEVEGGDVHLDRDGFIDLSLRPMEEGPGQLQIRVDPDPQFSTYIPLTVKASRDVTRRHHKTVMLGREWERCLDGLRTTLDDRTTLLSVLNQLAQVFPDSAPLQQHRGRVLYDQERFVEAREALDRSLALREDSATVAYNLFAALKRGERAASAELLGRLNLSVHRFFEELLRIVSELDESMALHVVEVGFDLFDDDKRHRLIRSAAAVVRTESGVVRLGDLWGMSAPLDALRYVHEVAADQSDWHRASCLVVEMAERIGGHSVATGHARRIVRWRGGAPADALACWHAYGRSIRDPRERTAVLLDNARGVVADHPGAPEGIEFALLAASRALDLGQIEVASQALPIAAHHIAVGGFTGTEVQGRLDALRVSLEAALAQWTVVEDATEARRRDLSVRLRPLLSGRTLAILGSPTARADVDQIAADLGVRVLSFPSTVENPVDERRLRALSPQGLIVVALWEHMNHLKAPTKEWLKQYDVPFLQIRGTGGLLIEELWERLGRDGVPLAVR
ncbi:hypothetical protein [Euzebya pacifica]|nr:hypothetical protein [Euzebya pacifica]